MSELTSLLDIPGFLEFSLFLNIGFCIWIIYFGGAEKLENSILGYMEFGYIAGEKASTIRFVAWLSLACTAITLLIRIFK